MDLKEGLIQTSRWMREESPGGKMIRLLVFLALYFLSQFLLLVFDSTCLGTLFLQPNYENLSFVITNISCFMLKPIYPNIHSNIQHVIFIDNSTPIQLQPGCVGLDQMIRVTFVLLCYPLRFWKKLFLLPISIGLLLIGTIIHFMILIPISFQYTTFFYFAHNWFTRIIFYGFFFLCWIIWERVRGGCHSIAKNS